MDVLNFWQDDPEELLLDLGFGAEEPDITVRIPARFINHPSQARGINVQVFLDAQQNRLDIENPDVKNRFRQIEVLQQVTTAFSSLVGGTPQASTKPVSEETREKRRRIGMLFRKASKKSLSQRANLRNQQPVLPLADNCSSTELPGDFSLDKRILMRPASLSPLIEEQSPISEGAEFPEPKPPPQDKNSSLRGGRELKNGTTTVGYTYKSPGETAESFELEEIQSFDEGIPGSYAGTAEGFHPGNERACLSRVSSCLVRTNSCQSDSSGFLEEPFVPNNPSPGPELMKVLNAMSGDSTDGQHKSVDQQDTELQSPCSKGFDKLLQHVESSATDPNLDKSAPLVYEGKAEKRNLQDAYQTNCLVNVVQKDTTDSNVKKSAILQKDTPSFLQGQVGENATIQKDLSGQAECAVGNTTLQKDSLDQQDFMKESHTVLKDLTDREESPASKKDTPSQPNYVNERIMVQKPLPGQSDSGGENNNFQTDLSGLSTTLQKDLPGQPEYVVGGATLQKDLPGHSDSVRESIMSQENAPDLQDPSDPSQKNFPDPLPNAQMQHRKSVGILIDAEPQTGTEGKLLPSTDRSSGLYSARSVSVQMYSNSQSSLKGNISHSTSLGHSAGVQRRDSFLRCEQPGPVVEISKPSQSVPANHTLPEQWRSPNSSKGVRGFGRHLSSSRDLGQSYEEDSRWKATLFAGAQSCESCQHKHHSSSADNLDAERQGQPHAATSPPYSVEELVGMMRCMWKFRKMISEIEDRLEEEQASVLGSLTEENRAEVQNILELRTAVKQEAGLLEQQLNDLLLAYDDNFKMKMNRLLDEQSHLCTELRFTSHPGHASKRSVGVQCTLLTDTPEDSQVIQDKGWSDDSKADKLGFVGFIRSLKDESGNNDSLE